MKSVYIILKCVYVFLFEKTMQVNEKTVFDFISKFDKCQRRRRFVTSW